MARPLRLALAGGLYHVASRGNERRPIFRGDEDRRLFLAVLRSVTERLNVLCHAFCLMGNHYHLLLETPDANISYAIRQLNGVYAQSFNRRHDRVGHLFQGRFHATVVEKETHLLAIARYIEQNPVRAGLVDQPFDWPWSSCRALVGLARTPPFLTTDWLLSCFSATDRNAAQHIYRKFVVEAAGEPLTTAGPVLGSDEFIARFREDATGMASVEIPRCQRLLGRPTLPEILASPRDRVDRNARIWRAHVEHGYSMIEIADYLGLHRSTVSRAIHEEEQQFKT